MSSSKDTREADEVSPVETKKGRGPLSRGAALMIAAAFVFSALSGIFTALSLNAALSLKSACRPHLNAWLGSAPG